MILESTRPRRDVQYAVKGMQGTACVAKVRDALAPFAKEVIVTLEPPRVFLNDTSRRADLQSLQWAMARLGDYRLEAVTPRRAFLVRDPNKIPDPPAWYAIHWPLIVILSLLTIVAFAGTRVDGEGPLGTWMMNFMAGVLLVFSAFKLFDLMGFASAFMHYDFIARRAHAYGVMYPLLELGLGFALLFRVSPTITLWTITVLMGVSCLGSLRATLTRMQVPWGYLGTVLSLPMATITLTTNVIVGVMAIILLARG